MSKPDNEGNTYDIPVRINIPDTMASELAHTIHITFDTDFVYLTFLQVVPPANIPSNDEQIKSLIEKGIQSVPVGRFALPKNGFAGAVNVINQIARQLFPKNIKVLDEKERKENAGDPNNPEQN